MNAPHPPTPRAATLRRTLLCVAVAMSLTGIAHGQATSGRIAGQAPVAANASVLIEGSNGLVREVPVDSRGRYAAEALPLSTYKVSLRVDGKVIDARDNVGIRVGASTDVSFASTGESAQQLDSVMVRASALPKIDVTSASSSTIITSEDLARLPLQRSAEGIALLAPGASRGSSYFSGAMGNQLVSFSGSAVTENAYYVNGFNTTDPLSGFGGISLPYGAINQQEVLSGGYSAAYGRSDGGVISQVGKSGTNEWHFGAQALWEPDFARSDAKDIYYVSGDAAGKIYQRNADNKSTTTTISGYAGGPLIKDKLFLFAAVETERTTGNNVGSVTSSYDTKYTYRDPKYYAKLDWNINDSNILELTGLSQTRHYDGSKYLYNYATDSDGNFTSTDKATKTSANIYVAKFTSYLTDDLTLTALYGKSKLTYFNQPPETGVTGPFIGNVDNENPALTGGQLITNHQTLDTIDNPDHKSTNRNLRIDLNYKIGAHSITAGIDNQDSHDIDDGTTIAGDGYELWYAHTDPNTNISESPFVGKPGDFPGGQTGYYAYVRHYSTLASVRVKQRAQYVMDDWQVTDRVLLQLGLRNDQFTNYNPSGQAYLRLTKPQWAPRLGASWDVNGDASLKVYANAGRYFLAMPASVALRTASGSLATNEYFTYTGIDANGLPTGRTPITSSTGGAVSPNGEYGQPPDPKTVSSKNIKSEYQDEFILGFDHQFDPAWVWGMKATVRKLRNALDDICDNGAIERAAVAQGAKLGDVTIGSCYLSNPGRANVYQLANANGGYTNVTVTNDDFGFSQLKRNYYGLDTYLSHPFDGTWAGKIDYLYSRSYGNTEGQVRSDTGQQSVSASRDWDYATLMEYSNGYLPNDRQHQLKAYGSWQIAPEWMISANLTIQSGTPRSCLGFYGTAQNDPSGYGSYYHYCDGKPSRPGDAGRTPWEELLDVSGEYRPLWADRKLAFNVSVFNLFNQQRATQLSPGYGSTTAVQNSFNRVVSYTTPRYVRFGVNYDF
ncbi:TonB-dependent receptor-like protein [Luteibacter rhizovicinus]|uniref:TonB-dependent receptor-like protein n=1 Tax=Luteibacter rhizovicinus TaxID=242606 RepID=A0A4R3YQY5_9GAMM|nr:TonB-dependent receptor [Luteibacter rhizovicinus]TCV94772.1 TonB-dependent receptor-like protein [Luteibacter rhizovicinus]